MFYFDKHWRVWYRRLLSLKGERGTRNLDMPIATLSIRAAEDDWRIISDQRIFVHRGPQATGQIATVVPADILNMMKYELGEVLTHYILNFDYVGHYGLPCILAAEEAWTGSGGLPASQIYKLAPIKLLDVEMDVDECTIVSVNDPVRPWGILDHSTQTLIGQGYTKQQCRNWIRDSKTGGH